MTTPAPFDRRYAATAPRDLTVTLHRAMAVGHYARKGHELAGYLASDDGELWHVVRTCC